MDSMKRTQDTCIVACETLKPELESVMKTRNCDYPVFWIDAGKHAWSDKLHTLVQEAIDGISPSFKTILLLFGFCGNAMMDIEARNHHLVLPQVADCIPLFIGSTKERESYGTSTYFFTEGYLNSGGSIASDIPRLYQRYGEEQTHFILQEMLGHYRALAVIDTGTFDVAKVSVQLEGLTKHLDIPVKVIPGNLRMISALLAGSWQDEPFLQVQPGGKITFEDSLASI
jgi:hypothetical protein